jgi:di/tricarboxylate transporter
MIVAGELAVQQFRSSKLPIAVGVVLSVVGVAALGILPIMVAALGGVLVMIVAGIIKPAEAYDAVQWDVIFLLAASFRSTGHYRRRGCRSAQHARRLDG